MSSVSERMRLILAVAVGLTSAAADGVCQDTGSSCFFNKEQCCTLSGPVINAVKACAAFCCASYANDQGVIPDCPNFNDPNKVDCECAVDTETDGPTAEPTPGPTPVPPICHDTRSSCNIVSMPQVCRPVRGPIITAGSCAGSSCAFLANEAGFGPECPNFYNPDDPNVPQLNVPNAAPLNGCVCAAEETDGPTAETTPGPTPALTPCQPCTTKTDCDESEICDGPSARRGLRFGIQQEGCCRGAR